MSSLSSIFRIRHSRLYAYLFVYFGQRRIHSIHADAALTFRGLSVCLSVCLFACWSRREPGKTAEPRFRLETDSRAPREPRITGGANLRHLANTMDRYLYGSCDALCR